MKTMPASKFKAQCLSVMDEVQATRQPVVITKKGRPVAKLIAADTKPRDIIGCLRGQVQIVGDIVSPVVPAEDWEIYR